MTPQRINIIALGVANLRRARGFYTRWGWTPCEEAPGAVFFDLGGFRLGLFGPPESAGGRRRPAAPAEAATMSLAQNFLDRDAVDAAFSKALEAGATLLKRPCPTDWGGYSGSVTDPDGHVWDLTHNPFWSLDNEGWLEPLA